MARSKYKLFELLEVHWLDAYCPGVGAKTLEDAKRITTAPRVTVGFFVACTEDAITIASTKDSPCNGETDPSVDDINCIPLGWTTEIRSLEV